MQILKGLIPTGMIAGMPYLNELGLNSRVLIFATAIAAFSAALFSFTPAFRLSTFDVREGMADGSRGSAGKVWTRIGSKLVVLELTTAMVLLVGAGLLGKSFYRLLQVGAGFETKNLITMRVRAPLSAYGEDEQAVALGRKVVNEIRRLPGVTSVAIAVTLPLTFNGNTEWIRFVGRDYNGEHSEVNQRGVTSDYFAIALGAQRGMVYRLILRDAGVLALAGIVIGAGCAILAASLMRKLLFGTPPWDITTLLCVAAVLGGSALLASFLPARRAASVDPISALRAE